ncbi:putative nuclease HARBI1 [Dendronephthya gigantea]|uniref:putative nuclease HARBI1 n=1 Tax=Dendronephthya gigantea TaxID=151771 RepID=UPI00106ABC36|nr:putative nuclease HARBI1 [Dendronephthya gigantea]
MKRNYLKTPNTQEEWSHIALDFKNKWNYPCCIGAIDGKHIAVQQPNGTGSEFFNYKHFFSVILLALVDANYKFIYVDVGAAGRAGDAGVFGDSALKEALISNSLNIPPATTIRGISTKVDYHIVADDAFPMTTQMMKPYPHRNLEKEKRIFNYRLSRARRVVENAFGILAHRWRVFLTTIKVSPDKVTDIILAACCLHNYMVDKNKVNYTAAGDFESADHTLSPGTWRNDPILNGLQPTPMHNPPRNAKHQREVLTQYFNNSGSVPWQDNIIRL